MEEFWNYVAEYIDKIVFDDIDPSRYDLLFSNESTVIMGKITKMKNIISPDTTLIFRPNMFIFEVPQSYKPVIGDTTVVMLRSMLIISNDGDEFCNPEVEKLYNAHKAVQLPKTWMVVKYDLAKHVDSNYEYDGRVISAHKKEYVMNALGEYQYSKLRIPIEYGSNLSKPLDGLAAELGIRERQCLLCKIAECNTELNEDILCTFCARLEYP